MAEVAITANWMNKTQATQHFREVVSPWCNAMWTAGHRLHIEIRLYEDAKTDRQRRYLHGVVFKTIALQACVDGKRYSLAVWKEHFRSQYLGYKKVTYINPITGRKSRRRARVSTEDLGVKAYSIFIEKVTAYAVTELGVRFPVSFEEWEACEVDPDTGEILGGFR